MHKISRIRMYAALCAALCIHLILLDYLSVRGAKPDLLLVLVIFYAFFFGERVGFEAGLFAGLLKDLFSFNVFGSNACAMGITGLLVGIFTSKLFKDSRPAQASLVFVFSMIAMMVRFLIASAVSRTMNLGLWEYLTSSALPSSIYAAIIALPLFSKLIEWHNVREEARFL